MKPMISVNDALAHIHTAAKQLAPETVITKALQDALSYRLAAPAMAKLTQPPANMSAMDGYAVKLADIKTAPVQLKLIGESRAGTPFMGNITDGQAVRIFTGAIVPKGADTVVIQENTEKTEFHVNILTAQLASQNIRPAGLDFTDGDILIPKGVQITPNHIAIAAAANISHLSVYRKLKVALLANGDELQPVGSALKLGEIINSNGPALSARLESWGLDVINLDISRDNEGALTSQIQRAVEADIIVPIGGASVGAYDLVQPVFQRLGYDLIFSKVAIKPGKPVWMAKKANQYVLGLPGNPASAIVCAHIFLRPLLGLPNPILRGRLSAPLGANGPRETYLRGSAHINHQGQLIAEAFPRKDSSLLTPFLKANILLRCKPNSPKKAAGEFIEVIPIDNLITLS